MIRNWADSSNPPSGSIKPIRHIDALWPPAPLAITFRSPLRLRWPLAVEPDEEHAFLTKFLAHWGQALEQSQGRRRRPRR